MELVDMKMPKLSKKELKATCEPVSDNGERWPWGLQLRFEKEQVDKIPQLADFKVGDMVVIQAEACVTSIRVSERQNGKDNHSIEMQIEQIACEPKVKKALDKLSPKEYRKAREGK